MTLLTQAELKSKDEEYVKAIKAHTSNIDELIERMSTQYSELRDTYENELDQVSRRLRSKRFSV